VDWREHAHDPLKVDAAIVLWDEVVEALEAVVVDGRLHHVVELALLRFQGRITKTVSPAKAARAGIQAQGSGAERVRTGLSEVGTERQEPAAGTLAEAAGRGAVVGSAP